MGNGIKTALLAAGSFLVTAGSAWANGNGHGNGNGGGGGGSSVPEIDATTRLAAIAVLLAVSLIVREMFNRRRKA